MTAATPKPWSAYPAPRTKRSAISPTLPNDPGRYAAAIEYLLEEDGGHYDYIPPLLRSPLLAAEDITRSERAAFGPPCALRRAGFALAYRRVTAATMRITAVSASRLIYLGAGFFAT